MRQRALEDTTFLQLGARKLALLCDALSVDEARRHELHALLELFLWPWGRLPVGNAPLFLSDITDDHTPFEFSVAFREGTPAIRILVEALPSDPTISSRWAAGLELNRALERNHGCSFERFHQIESLFQPTDPWARFGMWHAVDVLDRASFKLYLNPAAHGAERASSVVAASLERLGLRGALDSLPTMRPALDELKYFSLDLSAEPNARIKVYFSHRDIRVEDLERLMSSARDYQPGEATAFCRALGGHVDSFRQMPLQTCFAFTDGDPKPANVTLHFPVRAYAHSDELAMERITALLDEQYHACYPRMTAAFAERDLSSGAGLQTYASFRRQGDRRRVTIYLSPQAYAVQQVEAFAPSAPSRGAEATGA